MEGGLAGMIILMDNSDNPQEELAQELLSLKQQLAKQERFLSHEVAWQGDELYQQLSAMEKIRKEKQQEYKQLMRDRYSFTRRGWLERMGSQYIEERLKNSISNLNRSIDNVVYSRIIKSSLSSNSDTPVAVNDWLLQQKEDQIRLEEEKVEVEIQELEKILENLK